MDVLPDFTILRPTTIDEAVAARTQHPDARLLGGGTDLVVNIRRGIEAPPVLIEMMAIDSLRSISTADDELAVGASVRLSELADHEDVLSNYPVVAQAAHSIAGPTHREMGTVGGII